MSKKTMAQIAQEKSEHYAAHRICGLFHESAIPQADFLKALMKGIEHELSEAYLIGYREALEDAYKILGGK